MRYAIERAGGLFLLVDHRLVEGFVAEVEAYDGLVVFAGYGGSLVVGEAFAGFGEGNGEEGMVFGVVFVDVHAKLGSMAVGAFREVFEGVFVLTVELVPYCHCKFVVDRLHDGVLLLNGSYDVLADSSLSALVRRLLAIIQFSF